jgi:hypothetical protein
VQIKANQLYVSAIVVWKLAGIGDHGDLQPTFLAKNFDIFTDGGVVIDRQGF